MFLCKERNLSRFEEESDERTHSAISISAEYMNQQVSTWKRISNSIRLASLIMQLYNVSNDKIYLPDVFFLLLDERERENIERVGIEYHHRALMTIFLTRHMLFRGNASQISPRIPFNWRQNEEYHQCTKLFLPPCLTHSTRSDRI